MKELNNFQNIKEFIRNFIIEDEDLFKTIYFSDSSPTENDLPDDPYEIFTASSTHGCVLFRRKNDIVQSEEGVNLLITLYSVPKGNSKEFNDTYISVRVICKGVNVQELDDMSDRASCIARLFDNNFNKASIIGLGVVENQGYKELSLNEENSGWQITYTCPNFSYDSLSNKNVQKRFINGIGG